MANPRGLPPVANPFSRQAPAAPGPRMQQREGTVAERLIELGSVRIHLDANEDALELLRSLMRHVSNQEIADMLGISERTVRRWKHEGRLPRQGHARLKLADLIEHLARQRATPAGNNGNKGGRNGRALGAPAGKRGTTPSAG